ncbi:MAG: hypothetical protein PVF58_04950 [Candidatus Methanofastidiosia archaeon]
MAVFQFPRSKTTFESSIKPHLKNHIKVYGPDYHTVNMAKLKKKKQRIGWDFLIKIDEGEEDCLLRGLKELKNKKIKNIGILILYIL